MLRLHPRLAPYQVAVLPLSKKDTLTPLAHEIRKTLSQRYMVDYDETQAIGRRYRRQDEIGTPLAVTVDFDSLEDKAVTIRDRDSTEQVRVPDRRRAGRGRRPPGVLKDDLEHVPRPHRRPPPGAGGRRRPPARHARRSGAAAVAHPRLRRGPGGVAPPGGDRRDQAALPVEGRPATGPRCRPRSPRPTPTAARRACRCSPTRSSSAARSTTWRPPVRRRRCRCCARTSRCRPRDVADARLMGADAVLLIVAALDRR